MDNTIQTAGQYLDWGDGQWIYFKGWLEDLLRKETVEIQFIKADGTQRTMNATKDRLEQRVTERNTRLAQGGTTKSVSSSRGKRGGKEVEGNILVWDIDADDWRTIKLKNITNIYTLMLKYDFKVVTPFDGWE